MNTLICLMIFSAQSGTSVEADFVPRVRFLFRNRAANTVTVHTAVVEVKRAWVFRPLVPPHAPVDAPEVVAIELDARNVPQTIRRSIARKIPPDDVDQVHFHFKLKTGNIERDGFQDVIWGYEAAVFECRMKLLYGPGDQALESDNMLVFVKNHGAGDERSIDKAVQAISSLGLRSRNEVEAEIRALARINKQGAQEVMKLIGEGVNYNNNLKEFLERLVTTR